MKGPGIVEPSACTWCGIARRGHAQQYADAVGWHKWAAPSQAQILARMKARRLAAAVAKQGALPVPVGPEPQALSLSGPICSQAEARAAGLDIAPSVEELDAMASTIVAAGDPLSAEVDLARAVPLLGAAFERLRARAAELEAEREGSRTVDEDPISYVLTDKAETYVQCPVCHMHMNAGDHSHPEADGITRRIAPTQALREDLPETGGDRDPITYAGHTWPSARDWCLWIMQHNAAPGPAQNGQRAALDAYRAEVLAETHTVYRAGHDSIVMGLYTTREAAQAHCEAKVRQEEPAGSIRHLSWSADDIGDYAEYELHIIPAGTGELIRGTGYVVTPLEVASEHDEEADE